MAKKPLFSRGYNVSRERMEKNSYYSRSCFNCAYYYQMPCDKEEMCQNNEVIEYDVIVDGNNIYCLKWKPSSTVATGQEALFKKNGRARLD